MQALPPTPAMRLSPFTAAPGRCQAVLLALSCLIPFACDGRLHISLTGGLLSLHSYLPRTPATSLQATAQRMWPCDEDKRSSEQVAIVSEWDFSVARVLPMQMANPFTGWRAIRALFSRFWIISCRAKPGDTPIYLPFCPAEPPCSCFESVNVNICRGSSAPKCCNPGQFVNCHRRCSTRLWITKSAGQPIAFSDNGTHCSKQLYIARYSFTVTTLENHTPMH